MIKVCIDHPNSVNQLFIVSDGSSFSTFNLISMICGALSQNHTLFNVPLFFLRLTASISGNSNMSDKLLDGLEVDIQKTCYSLISNPIYNTE